MRASILGSVAFAALALACGSSSTVYVDGSGSDAGAGVDAATVEGEGTPDAAAPVRALDLGSSTGFGRCLAADEQSVYACDNAKLVRYEIATGKATTVWTTPGGTMRGVEILDGKVYATDGDSVSLVSADGSPPKQLLRVVKIKGNQYPATWRLGARGTSLFVYDDASLVQFNSDGSGTPVRTKVESFFYLFPAGSNLWLISHFDDFTIRVVAASAPQTTLTSLTMSDAQAKREHGETLAGTKGYVFSSEDSGATTTLIRYDNPTGASAPVRKELGELRGPVSAMVADETNLFVTTGGGLYRYALDGKGEVELATGSMSGPVGLNKDYAFVVDATDASAKLRGVPRR